MRTFHCYQPLARRLALGTACLLGCFLAGSLILMADTPQEVQTPRVETCYCRCAEGRAHRGCVKMCQLPKYASREWATNCAKQRLQLPVEKQDAGPRFEHPGRNERAQSTKATAGS